MEINVNQFNDKYKNIYSKLQKTKVMYKTFSLIKFAFSISKFTTYKDVVLKNSQIKKAFMRSSGPGGQSVNTTSSKAEVRITINQCQVIDSFILQNIKSKYRNFVNKSGQLIVSSQIHKSQKANLEQCIQKIQKIIFNCSQVPEQRKYEIPAETQQLEQMRIQSKRKKSIVKQRRINTKDLY